LLMITLPGNFPSAAQSRLLCPARLVPYRIRAIPGKLGPIPVFGSTCAWEIGTVLRRKRL